jgi:hypothetical protein
MRRKFLIGFRLGWIFGLIVLNPGVAQAQIFSWDDISSFIPNLVNVLQNASNAQGCPSIDFGQELSMGKVIEVSARQEGTEDVYVLRSPYGQANDQAVKRSMRVEFKYQFPCTDCEASEQLVRNRAFHYAQMGDAALATGKALYFKVLSGQEKIWQVSDLGQECVYSIRTSDATGFSLPSVAGVR